MKNFIVRALVALAALCALPSYAQFSPGQPLTASQLNASFASVLPLSGGSLTGPLSVPSLNVSGALTAGTLSPSALSTSNATITGGAIDGSAIGQVNPNVGTFTNFVATGSARVNANNPRFIVNDSLGANGAGYQWQSAGTLAWGLTNSSANSNLNLTRYIGGVSQGPLLSFDSPTGMVSILNNTTAAPAKGYMRGLRVCNCNGAESSWINIPGAGDSVAFAPYIDSAVAGNRVGAENPLVDVMSGSDATAWVSEFDMNNMVGVAPDPGNTNHKIGLAVTSGGLYPGSAPFTAGGTSSSNAWKHGLWFTYIGYQTGSTLIHTTSSTSVDYGLDLSPATVNYQGVRVGATPSTQVAGVASRQFANGGTALYLQRFTDTSPTGRYFSAVNAANTVEQSYLDAGGNFYAQSVTAPAAMFTGTTTVSYANPRFIVNDSSGTNAAGISLRNNGTIEWSVTNNSSTNSFGIGRYNGGSSVDTPLSIDNTTGIVSFVDGITVKGTAVNPNLSGTSSSLGGSALAAGACTSGTVSIAGATTSMAVAVSPAANPGTGFDWNGYVSAAGTVTVNLCAIAAGTPTATTYNVRVLQ